jgi:hypothetical protein
LTVKILLTVFGDWSHRMNGESLVRLENQDVTKVRRNGRSHRANLHPLTEGRLSAKCDKRRGAKCVMWQGEQSPEPLASPGAPTSTPSFWCRNRVGSLSTEQAGTNASNNRRARAGSHDGAVDGG